MSALSYRQFAPRSELERAVDAFWVNTCEPGEGVGQVLPDGCIDLVFRADPERRELFASALTTEPVSVRARPGAWFVGVRFRPGMSRVVLDLPAVECRDANVDATEIDVTFAALRARLSDAASPAEALSLLEAEVSRRARLGTGRGAPPRVCRAIELLELGAAVSAAELARDLGMSERNLHRDLVAWTGLAPKVLARIFRMQRATTSIQAGGTSLARVALDAGYSDQPHMTRELRRLTGRSPAAHARR